MCLETLTAADASIAVQSVPNGIKSNMYFVVSNTENEKRLANGEKRIFYDDCGAWSNTRGYNMVVLGDDTKELHEKNGLVCARKRINGKDQLIALEPQPHPSTVRRITHYYYKLKRSPDYTKRITILHGCSVYVCEYLGIFPTDVSSHGNCASDGTEYVRVRPEVTASVKEHCTQTKAKPNQIYSTMVLDATDVSCPRKKKQVQNISAAVTSNLINEKIRGTNNLADEMNTLCSLVVENDFVKNVSFTADHAPCVVLFTKEQLSDVKRFCGANAPDKMRSVLCVDRTFNLSSLFVTITVFKNQSVLRNTTMQPPIFLGPLFLHGDGQFMTYLTFFNFLRGMLDTDLYSSEVKLMDGIVTGSDEEAALVKAMRVAFPNSKHLFCILHCQDNVRDHLTKVGVELRIREHILNLLFGSNGVSTSANESEFENRQASTLQYVRQYCSAVEDYICMRILPKLLSNCQTLWTAPWLGPQRWTNNSCESANNLLKLTSDWKPARLTELVAHLHNLVKTQYKNVQRAMIGQGDFQLAPTFLQHKVSFCRWQGLSDDQRAVLTNAFLNDSGHIKGHNRKPTVTSSDGSLTVVGTNKVARKPGQRKRPRTERTVS